MKSFEHAFDRLEERCHAVLDLISSFDERYIRSDADWESKLYPALRDFLLAAAKDQPRLRLALDATSRSPLPRVTCCKLGLQPAA